MANRFAEMWRWQGTIGRKSYATAGCRAFVLKYFLDKFVAFAVFGRVWHLWSYWQPLEPNARVNAIPSGTRAFVATLLILAPPFIWLGVTLTVKRLRDAGKPLWPVVLFFIPVINLLFFLLLCTMRSHSVPAEHEATPWPETRGLHRWIPRSAVGAAAVSVALTIVMLMLSALGGMLGYAIQTGYWLHKGTPATLSIVLLFTPAFQSVEHWAKLQPETFEVRTAIEVNAPPEKVWN